MTRISRGVAVIAPLLFTGGVVAASGCSSILGFYDGARSDGSLGQPCDASSGSGGSSGNGSPVACAAGLVCVSAHGSDGLCAKVCAGDKDCAPGERCGPSSGTQANVCARDVPCQTPGGCKAGFACECVGGSLCASDFQCRAQCSIGGTPACLQGQHCVAEPPSLTGGSDLSGACYGDGEARDGGALPSAPVVVADNASGASGAFGIAVDEADVYWTTPTANEVYRCPLATGCAGSFTSASVRIGGNATAPSGIAVGATSVFWGHDTNPGAIFKCARGGSCSVGTQLGPSTFDHPFAVAAFGSNVAWRNGNGGQVVTCASSSCTAPFTVAVNQQGPGAIALDDTFVYWMSVGSNVLRCGISTCTQSGPNQPTLLNASGGTVDLAADSTGVYFIQGNVISACPSGTCVGPSPNPNVLASQQRNPIAIAVDSASVYWLTRDGGEVMRCAKRGCDQKPTVLASGIQGLARLAVDASSVYFTAGDKVLKVPK